MEQFKEEIAKLIEENINNGKNLDEINTSMSEVLLNYAYGGAPGQRFILNVQNQCPGGQFKLSQVNAFSLMTLLTYDWIRKGIIAMDFEEKQLEKFTEMLANTFEDLAKKIAEEGKKIHGFTLQINYEEPAEEEPTEDEDKTPNIPEDESAQ